MRRFFATGLATLALAMGAVVSTSSPAAAAGAPGCSAVSQIGATAYIWVSGSVAASVKQYVGCDKNFAYVYVWQSFRTNHGSWDIAASINTSSATGLGKKWSTGIEVWSLGTNTLNVCTRGIGQIEFSNQGAEAATDNRC
ncbi:hypothetical protein ACWD3Z_13870 [Streptomyces sp. NPDC002740]